MVRFEKLYLNSIIKETTLDEVEFWVEENWIWNLPWRRQWFEWEKTLVDMLMQAIEEKTFFRDRLDGKICNAVQSTYTILTKW